MADAGAVETDRIIAEIEARIKVEYGQAQREIEEKLKDYLRRYELKNQKWQEWVSRGVKAQEQYNAWKTGQMAIGKRWEDMRDSIARDLLEASRMAKTIAAGYVPEVYALNHDYGTYQIEHESQLDTSYTLYDRGTAARIFRDDPQMLPDPGKKVSQDIREGRAVRWNNRHIQSVMMQALLQGNSIPDIAHRLANAVGDTDRKAANRNARTMMTGAQNAGRVDSYKRAAEMGIKTRMQWLATLDNRTRHEHRLLDGMTADLDKPFEVEGETIRYPGDPQGPPHLVWNCRCTLIAAIKGYERDLSDTSLRHNKRLGEMSYEEWKEAKATSRDQLAQEQTAESFRRQYIREYRENPKAKVGPGWDMSLDVDSRNPGAALSSPGNTTEGETVLRTPVVSDAVSFNEGIGFIRDRIEANGGKITEADLLEAGKLLAQEYDSYKAVYYEQMMKAHQAFDDFLETSGYTAARKKYYKFFKDYGWETTEIPLEISEAEQLIFDIEKGKEWADLKAAMTASRKAYEGTPAENAAWLKRKLSEIRDMGASGINLRAHFNKSRSQAVKYLESAYDCYPTDWVERSVANGNLKPGVALRGYYNDRKQEIKISGLDDNQMFGTAIHELGHRFEMTVPYMRLDEKVFYKRRTAGEELEWLGGAYGKDEVTRKDNFLDPYMGKDYDGRWYELVSMGFEYAYTDPEELAQDKDMQAWIYGLLCLR